MNKEVNVKENKDYQIRVLCEYAEIVRRRCLLSSYIENENNFGNEIDDIMLRQLKAMSEYEECLYIRISNFLK